MGDRPLWCVDGSVNAVVAPIGQWMTIGGASQQSNEVIRAVLEAGRGEKSSMTSISLLVESGN
jgi:hypothetical protein